MKRLKGLAALVLCLGLTAAACLPVPAVAGYPELTPEDAKPLPADLWVLPAQQTATQTDLTATGTEAEGESREPEEDPLSKFTLNHGSRNSRKIAITMDDMFDTEWTWKTLELCRRYGITMTFFPVGSSLKEEDRANWQAVVDAGCEIASHSSYHANFKGIGEWIAIGRLGRFQEALDRTLGYHYEVRWFRPPFGNISDGSGNSSPMVRAIRTYGYEHIVRWDVSNTDADKAFEATQNGSILLYQSRHKDYVCLTELIPRLLEAGYQPVTVSELFGFPPPETGEELYHFDIHDYVGK